MFPNLIAASFMEVGSRASLVFVSIEDGFRELCVSAEMSDAVPTYGVGVVYVLEVQVGHVFMSYSLDCAKAEEDFQCVPVLGFAHSRADRDSD